MYDDDYEGLYITFSADHPFEEGEHAHRACRFMIRRTYGYECLPEDTKQYFIRRN